MTLFRKSGISLLVPTQNSEHTVEMCIRSFAGLADEIIVVDNGSTDRTIAIVQQMEREFPILRFYNAPHLKHLYENRQYALERSSYKWIARIDSDFVAYTDGPLSSRNLRKIVLGTKTGWRPIAFTLRIANLFLDLQHTGTPRSSRPQGKGRYVPELTDLVRMRIVEHFPGMRFGRVGRWESVRYAKFWRKVDLTEQPFWFHCEMKSPRDYFLRSQRTDWRENGNFSRFPTVEDFALESARRAYGTNDLDKAAEIYMHEEVYPFLKEYDPSEHYPYPETILAMGATALR